MAQTSAGQRIATAWLLVSYFAQPLIHAIQPISVYFDDQYRGYDGFWSTAQIGIGSPPQYLSLLPNTVSSEVWVAGPGGCDGTLTCQQTRGGLFYKSNSTSWDELGDYEIGDTLLPTPIPGEYGTDMVTISNSVSASNQSIAILNTTEIWLGSLGLNIRGTQYGGSSITRLSLITSLVHNESESPSNSYGYTAGAYYAQQSVPGSLTLGGSDITRYSPNSISFPLRYSDNEPVLAIQTITVSSSTQPVAIPSSWNANPLILMAQQDAAIFTIDSSTPFLWFPSSVCDSFASALNLTYNSDLNLYVFSDSASPQNLTDLGLTFTFKLAGTTTDEETISIPISYNAFNLQLKYPFPGLKANASSAPVNYFPLRRANSSLEYVIGRSFLQEAYIVVDYERGNFSIAAAIFPDLNTVKPNLVPITRPADSQLPGPELSGSLSTGAKAGIGVGVSIAILAIAGIIAFLCIKKRRSQQSDGRAEGGKKTFGLLRFAKLRKNSPNTANELPADKRHPEELLADKSNTRFELPSGDNPVEMPAGDIPDSYLQRAKDLESPSGDHNRPSSIEKGQMMMQTSGSERSGSPVPPYSAADAATQNKTNGSTENNTNSSSAISPTSEQFHTGFHGSHSSGEQAVSPIANSSSASGSFPGSDAAALASLMTQSGIGSQQASANTNSPARNVLHSARNSVQQGQGPSRTLSRNSRFREELTDEVRPPASEAEPPQLRQRFSFEQ